MRRLSVLLLMTAAACSGGYAASNPRTGTQTVVLEEGLVPPGSRLWLELAAGVDDEAPAGERFRARLVGSLFTPDGDLLVPRGALVDGRVIRTGDSAWLRVEGLEMAGARRSLHGHIVGVTPPSRPGIEAPDRLTAADGISADLPAGTRLELRLCAPLLPMAEDDA